MTRVDGKSPARGKATLEKKARETQARAEGAKTGDTITWKGETFRLAPGEMPGAAQLLLAHMANQDMTTADPGAEDGIWMILEMCLARPSGPPPENPAELDGYDPGDFKKFMRHAAKTLASLDEIVDALKDVVEIMSARRFTPPPSSSNGRPQTTANLTAISSAAPATE